MKASLTGTTLAELYKEIGKRRQAMKTEDRGGRPASCECGECPTCRKRIAQRKWRAGKK
jgi:hypothetical protein